MKEIRIQSITSEDAAYPALLKQIKDYPKKLYYVGNIELLKTRCVSVIGSRTTTTYGRNTARAAGRCLAECGLTIVSGMAAGIDTCAHEGALAAGGDTIAVLGCGVDICYPLQNMALMQRIEKSGLIISEYEPGSEPMAYMFPQRNRIISGLSEMTLVIQARNRSGSLITAELAVEQGREVFAFPGNIDSQYNLGSNKLIQEGAGLVARIDDLPEIMGLGGRISGRRLESLTSLEQKVCLMLRDKGELTSEEVCIELGDSPRRIAPVLSVLEIKGYICSASGKFFLANG